jgi:hypothetical protein
VGKSALLEYTAGAAADMRVVRAAGVESEMELAFAGLHQLCAPLLDRLDVLVAEGEHQDNVHNALYAELARGAVLPATRARFRAAITDLAGRGAEVIVLACTEFGMVVQPGDSPVPVIDTTIAHAQAAVEMALAGQPEQPGT